MPYRRLGRVGIFALLGLLSLGQTSAQGGEDGGTVPEKVAPTTGAAAATADTSANPETGFSAIAAAAAHTPAQAHSPTHVCIPQGARSGDLIFRKGTERVSDLVRGVDDTEFSHVGLLIATHDLPEELRVSPSGGDSAAPDDAASTAPAHYEATNPWHVLHATPSEVAGRPSAVVLDPLDFFTSPALSKGHAVYHVATADDAQRAAAVADALAELGKPFSLMKAGGLYCTELPYNAWLHAGVDLDVRFRKLAVLLFAPKAFILPGDLLASPKLERLGEY